MSEAFTKADIDAPRLMAEMLLEHVLECDRLKLYTDADRPASPDELAQLRDLAKRALKHEPVQYLVGEAWFYGLRFGCDARGLVPRPCTEVIVQRVVDDWAGRFREELPDVDTLGESVSEGVGELGDEPVLSESASDRLEPGATTSEHSRGARRKASSDHGISGPLIADVCTGSGCIAIALAKSLPGARVIATDVSLEALELARENAERLGVADRIEFRAGDLLDPLTDAATQIDYLVSNPPYIPDDEWAEVPANVKDHEPELALRGGTDGMRLVKPILEQGPGLLKAGGRILVEVAMSRAGESHQVLAAVQGVGDVQVHKDQDGLLRVVEGVRIGGG